MEYNHQKIVRHMALTAVILTMPFVFQSQAVVWQWYGRHLYYWIAGFIFSTLIAVISDYLVRQKWLGWLNCSFGSLESISKEPDLAAQNPATIEPSLKEQASQRNSAAQAQSLFCRWASCSRCVAWWMVLLPLLLVNSIYWQYGDSIWTNMLVAVLFSGALASYAAGMTILVFFIRLMKK